MIKHSFIIIMAVVCSLTAFGQGDAVSTIYARYANDDSFSKVSISSKMFQLFTHIEGTDKEEKELLETIAMLKGMKVLSKDECDGKKMYRDAIKLAGNGYEELMSVKDGNEDLTFFIKESGGKIVELLMLTGGEKNFLILSLVGDIDLNKVAKLSRSMNIGGMNQLQKVEGAK